jgi:hypothetical protein
MWRERGDSSKVVPRPWNRGNNQQMHGIKKAAGILPPFFYACVPKC